MHSLDSPTSSNANASNQSNRWRNIIKHQRFMLWQNRVHAQGSHHIHQTIKRVFFLLIHELPVHQLATKLNPCDEHVAEQKVTGCLEAARRSVRRKVSKLGTLGGFARTVDIPRSVELRRRWMVCGSASANRPQLWCFDCITAGQSQRVATSHPRPHRCRPTPQRHAVD